MQVYLPDDLYRELKARRLPASELLQRAVRAELRRRVAESETDRYLADVRAEVGEPSADQRARAAAVVRRATKRRPKRAG
jgi:post-segregation antitoxin (ccd killing protein)